jgi:L-alanine-DL-glutamate epimerase-like enolase superfamily enzyme
VQQIQTQTQTCLTIASVAVQRREGEAMDLIEVRTAEGLTGYGEGAWCEDLLRRKPELVVGRSAFEVESIFEDLAASGETPGGLDIALWDLIGKALDMPVSRVLGKTYRSRVQVCIAAHETQSAPIAAGLSLPLDTLVRDLVQNKQVDIAMQDVARCGLTGLRRLAYLCWVFRVRLAPCCTGTPTGTAAVLHAAACIPPSTNAINAPPVFVVVPGKADGTMEVPSGPGLGVKVAPIAGTAYFEAGGVRC